MLTLTEAASRKLGEVLAQQREHGKAYRGLRLTASPGCCSGPEYGLSLAEETREGDWIGEYAGIQVMVDRESAPWLSGARIDFVETPEGAGFTIEKPSPGPEAAGGCACGGGGCGGH